MTTDRATTARTRVGVGLRRSHFRAMRESARTDGSFFEVVAENFVGFGGAALRALEHCRSRADIAVHGVALDLGGRDPIDWSFVRALKTLLDRLEIREFSEHACFSRLGGVHSLDLLPLPFTWEAARHLARRAREVSDALERPLLLENITYYARMPGSDRDEGEFLRAVLEEADAFLLLDVNNVYVNARNHALEPAALLASLPLDRVRQIHLAGHRTEYGVLLDDHGSAMPDPVLALYRQALARTGSRPTIVEWDHAIPSFDALLDEADRVAREITA